MSRFARRLQQATVATTPAGGGTITHGSQINATNTGIAGIGVARSSLAVVSASQTVTNSGAVISDKLFLDGIVINADNVRVTGCQFECHGINAMAIQINGLNCIIEDTTIVADGGGSTYECIMINNNGAIVRRVDASISENIITVSADNVLIQESYLHDTSNLSNPAAHQDVIEVYGGSNVTIQRNRIFMHADETSCINIAPWFGASSSNNVIVDDNWIDGGNSHILVDLQSTGTINGTKVRRNIMGGHTNPLYGRYSPFQNNDNRIIVQTDAAQTASPGSIMWPTSGPDASHWGNCSDLVPDNTGVIVLP